MKLVIAQQGCSRELAGSFSLCGSKADLLRLAAQITAAVGEDYNFGWIEIHEPLERTPNCPVRQWTNDADVDPAFAAQVRRMKELGRAAP